MLQRGFHSQYDECDRLRSTEKNVRGAIQEGGKWSWCTAWL